MPKHDHTPARGKPDASPAPAGAGPAYPEPATPGAAPGKKHGYDPKALRGKEPHGGKGFAANAKRPALPGKSRGR